MKEQIKTTLRNKQLQDNIQAKFDGLKKAANVKIDDDGAREHHAAARPARDAEAMGGASVGGH